MAGALDMSYDPYRSNHTAAQEQREKRNATAVTQRHNFTTRQHH